MDIPTCGTVKSKIKAIEKFKQEDELLRVKEKMAARSKAHNGKLAVQGNKVKDLEEDNVALKKVAALIRYFSRDELVVTEVEERQAHRQKIDSMDKETQTSELPQDENNALQEELMKLRASYHEVCLNQTINQEKLDTVLQKEKQEKNALQEELMKLRASYHEVCLNQTINQENFNIELQKEKQEKIALQEQLRKLSTSFQDVCLNQYINQDKLDTKLQKEKQEKNALQEQLTKLSSFQEVCLCHDVSSSQLNGESKDDLTEEKSLSSVLPEKQKETSVWKRICSALGLRKTTALGEVNSVPIPIQQHLS